MAMQPQEWTLAGLAVELPTSYRQISKLLSDVAPSSVEGRSKRFRMADVVAALIANAVAGKTDDQARLLKARADQAVMETERLSGTLVPAEDVGRVFEDVGVRFRQRMLVVPTKTAPLVATESEVDVCYKIIETLVHEALNELASTDVQIGRGRRDGKANGEAISGGRSTAGPDG